ncbi:MAG TPA: 2OG-Fe(II) oxygenase, partial [Planctomycetaceae bacterium]|nr:2OG-Fe(II) oxygenase [Planctomycetaceae bacterium]
MSGCLPVVDPGLEVEGLGPVAIPLKQGKAKPLIACCRVAPYGKGTRTLVDPKVRNTFELDPRKFRLSDEWNAAIAGATLTIAEQFGLPTDQLEARLYKLLVYEKGGFFLPHRDSEKLDRMLASLIVVLPSPFEGGSLIVRHGGADRTLAFEEAAAGKSPCFAAFYADCEHEVERVTRGVRMALAYNLVLKRQRGKSTPAAKPAAP